MIKHRTARMWLMSGRAMELPPQLSAAFDDHIASLPWAGTTGLDWSQMPPSRQANVVQMSSEELYQWAKTTRLGNHSHIAVWYSRSEGGVVLPLHEGMVALDELYIDAPGPRFSCGVDIIAGVVRAAFTDLLQYGYGDLLFATA